MVEKQTNPEEVNSLWWLLSVWAGSYYRDLMYCFSHQVGQSYTVIRGLYYSLRLQFVLIAIAVLAFDCLSANLADKQMDVSPINLGWVSIDVLPAIMNVLLIWFQSISLIKGIELFGVILLLFLAFSLARRANVASKIVTIDEFKDCRQKNHVRGLEENVPNVAEDLHHRLAAELTRIRSLYENVAGSMDVTYGYRPEPPRITADYSTTSKNISQSNQPLSIGPINLPQEIIRDIASRVVRGTRITGILFEEDDRLHLVAHRIDNEEPLSWTVVGPKKAHGDGTSSEPALNDMIHELACRIFTSIYTDDATEWKAVQAFNRGLEEYLHSKAKPQGRTIGLIRAEEKFIETLSEDSGYHNAYHNLGVIYREQKKWQAAERVFILSTHSRPKEAESYYTLALNYFDEAYDHLYEGDIEKRGSLERDDGIFRDYWSLCRVIELCDACLMLQPVCPKAYELKGFAYGLRGYITEKRPDVINRPDPSGDLDYPGKLPPFESGGHDSLDHAIQCRRIAVEQSWKLLCQNLLRPSQKNDRANPLVTVTEDRDRAYKCLNNMAYTLHLKSLKRKSGNSGSEKSHSTIDRLSLWLLSQIQMRIYRQALALNPSKANPHLGIGGLHLMANRPDLAIESFKRAISIDYTLPTAWMYLALAYNESIANIKRIQKPGAKHQVGYPDSRSTMPGIYRQGRDHALIQFLNYIEELKPLHLYRIAEEFENRIECKDITLLIRRSLAFLEETRKCESSKAIDLSPPEIPSSGIEHLRSIYDDWQKGESLRVQGINFLSHGEPGKADEMFIESLQSLKTLYPERIRRNAIYASQAHAQLQKKDYPTSIKTTHDALLLDPGCSHSHLRRGQGLYGINDLDHCINEYRLALQCDPEQPEIYFRIGQVDLLRAKRSHNPEEKRELSEEASNNFKIALELRKGESKDIAKMYYWLGKSSLIMGSYHEARAYLETAESLSIAPIKVAFHLGEAYLGMGLFATSENYFEQVRRHLDKSIRDSTISRDSWLQSEVEEFLEDDVCAGALLARWHIRNATLAIHTSQSGEEAEKHLEAVREIIGEISSTTTRRDLESEYLRARRWLLKQKEHLKPT